MKPKAPNASMENAGGRKLLSTREVARFIGVNEKMVYSLVSDKGLPATKITGKWLFPRHLVEQWIEMHTINYPRPGIELPPYHGLLIVTGSNDPLLDKAISLFNSIEDGHVAVFGNLGSMGGLRALRQNLCHIASSHLLQENENEYNFEFAAREFERLPAIVNFCRREQGLLIAKANPKQIASVADLGRPGIRMVNRALGTGTRLLLDHELAKSGIQGDRVDGYARECSRHLDVGLEVLSGRADAGPGIRAVAGFLNLDFVPLRWERYDLMISKERFFDEGVQRFLSLLHEPAFRNLTKSLKGYDLSLSGKMVFPKQQEKDER
jgi:excisionase family DNA binding protein